MAALMAAVGIAAAALAALKSANVFWRSVVSAFVIGLLLFAVLGCIHSSGAVRRFWSGVALFGWAYLALVYVPSLQNNVGAYMPTEYFLQWAYPRMSQVGAPVASSEHVSLWLNSNGQIFIDGIEATDDEEIVQLSGKAIGQKNWQRIFLFHDPNYGQSTQMELDRLTTLLTGRGLKIAGRASAPISPKYDDFACIGRFLTAPITGLIGGLLAQFFLRRTDEAKLPA
jgi:hypothetical protein